MKQITFTSLEDYKEGKVTSSNDELAKKLLKGSIMFDGMPKTQQCSLCYKSESNFFNISRLYNKGLRVNFSKQECTVTNKSGEIVMTVYWIICYGVTCQGNCTRNGTSDASRLHALEILGRSCAHNSLSDQQGVL